MVEYLVYWVGSFDDTSGFVEPKLENFAAYRITPTVLLSHLTSNYVDLSWRRLPPVLPCCPHTGLYLSRIQAGEDLFRPSALPSTLTPLSMIFINMIPVKARGCRPAEVTATAAAALTTVITIGCRQMCAWYYECHALGTDDAKARDLHDRQHVDATRIDQVSIVLVVDDTVVGKLLRHL